MQKLILVVLVLILNIPVFSQEPSISPEVNDEQCPDVNVTFLFNFGTFSASDYTIKNDATLKGCTIISNIDQNGNATIKFTDKKEDHKFVVKYGPSSAEYTFTFTKIKTLDGLKPTYPASTPGIFPYPPDYDDNISLPPCLNTEFPYTCPQLKYKDASGNEYGFPMNNGEWLVPKGWKVDGEVSDGVTHINSTSPSVHITPDPFNDGEVKYRAKNNCDPFNLKPSNYYKLLITRPGIRLTVDGFNPITINCGEVSDKTFTLENINNFLNCITGPYLWKIGSNAGWLYNGQPIQGPISTNDPYITLTTAGNQTAPSNVTVTITHASGATYDFTVPVNFNPCSQSSFNISPSFFSVICAEQTPQTLTINEGNISPSVTTYEWNLGPTPNGWLYNGLEAPEIVPTNEPTLDISSNGATTSPSQISVQPFINNEAFPYTYSPTINFIHCCASAPIGLIANITNLGTGILSWDPTLTATSYEIEYNTSQNGGINSVTSNTNSTNYYGQSGIDAQFRVRAICSNGLTSPWSEWKVFYTAPTSLCNLPTPSNLVANNACGSGSYLCGYITYSWSAVTGAAMYEVESIVFNPSIGISNNPYTFSSTNNSISVMAYTPPLSGTGWRVKFRIRSKCSNNTWTTYSNWSSDYYLN